MIGQRPGALPVFWQTLLLLFAVLVIAQAIGVLLLFVEPPPRPAVNRLSDIAETLGGGERDGSLDLSAAEQPPVPRVRMRSEESLVRALAERLRVDPGKVRLYFEPERPISPPFARHRRSRRPVSMRDGEPLFFTPIVAGLNTGHGWRIAASPPPPLIAPWQRRMMLWFAASALALLPLAWVFARAITGPIRRFADAADRLGSDPQAPAVREEGPAELRVTARALNRMQARLGEYVGERTTMIGAIAHDLRTPLARIAFRIEGAPAPMRDKVLADVEQMRAMLAATIGFVRNTDGTGARVPLDLCALLAAMVEQDRDLGRAVTMLSGGPARTLGDPMALERLFQNLIDNGLAYGDSVIIGCAMEEDEVVVRIADEGPGLPEPMLARVFQPFVRGDPSRNRETGGIGLGLTIARTIAENHGGSISLANQAGGGLEAICRLPAAV